MCEVTPDGDIVIGRPRPKNNPLIHHSVVGKPSFHNNMPPLSPEHTFGAALKRDPEGAGDVMLSWNTGPSTHAAPDGSLVQNRSRTTVVNGRQFVADPDRVYGRPSGDTSRNNMADLLQNRYELEWVNEQRVRYDGKAKAEQREKQRKAAPTRISIERNERMQKVTQTATKPHPKEYFTLSQFRDVPSRFASPSPTAMVKGYFSPASRTRVDCDAHNTNSTTAGESNHEDIPEQHHDD
eukprot:GILI01004722.1.p1 GENE.GILI01004722.1~~GILI01004722.1.p1  ORF type:complete len:238 (-),score=43.56 GILI01004722.1:189-902(-)